MEPYLLYFKSLLACPTVRAARRINIHSCCHLELRSFVYHDVEYHGRKSYFCSFSSFQRYNHGF